MVQARTTFEHGLILQLPDGKQRRYGACQWHDDPMVEVKGRILLTYRDARAGTPYESEGLPIGTVVRRWDDDNRHPVIGRVV